MSSDAEQQRKPGGRPITAIIVSYNTRALTLECLARAMPQLRGVGGGAILVDNASADESAAAVREAHTDVHVVSNLQNVGFGPANNQAIELAPAGHDLLLLNSDAFVHPGAIDKLAAYLADHATVGIVGPRLLNGDGTLQPSAWPFPTPARSWVEALGFSFLFRRHFALRDWRRWSYDRSGPVPWLIGACLLVRRDVFDRVGGFDESFFLYGEETEWQRRVRDAGWDVHFVSYAEVTHLGGASGLSAKERTRSLFFDGLDRYLRKHHGIAGVLAARLAMVSGGVMRLVAFSVMAILRPRDARFEGRATEMRWMLRRHMADWRCLRAGRTR